MMKNLFIKTIFINRFFIISIYANSISIISIHANSVFIKFLFDWIRNCSVFRPCFREFRIIINFCLQSLILTTFNLLVALKAFKLQFFSCLKEFVYFFQRNTSFTIVQIINNMLKLKAFNSFQIYKWTWMFHFIKDFTKEWTSS